MLVYTVVQTAGSRYLSLSQALLILKGLTALPPRRSPLVLRLFALALADGSGLPFSLYPPPAALESQTPQREARALPRRAPKLAASERKIVTKETHQGCLSFLFKSPLPCKGEARALPRRAQIHRDANLTQQSLEIPSKAALCERKNKKV